MRIVGGRWRGRRLAAPAGSTTRPTSDRVREAIFDAIGARTGGFEALTVLDLFAGTGALGLEALSRGADRAVFVESSRAALSVLSDNISALDACSHTSVIAGDALGGGLQRALGQGPFALLLADPPYRIDPAAVASAIAACHGATRPGALFAWEHPATLETPPVTGWRVMKTYVHGDTAFTLLERTGEGETA